MYYTNKIDTILFDMDGTVLDSEGVFEKAQLLLLEEYNIFINIIFLFNIIYKLNEFISIILNIIFT